jgi:hypothetical protein
MSNPQHSIQWVETIDLSVVAMKALLQNTATGIASLFETIMATLTKLNSQKESASVRSSSDHRHGYMRPHYDSLEWVYDPPGKGPLQCMYRG